MIFKDLLNNNRHTELNSNDIDQIILTDDKTIQITNLDSLFYECNLQVNAYINATLTNNTNIDGQIFSVDKNGFMIDDNITGDIFKVNNNEIETVNEYIQ